MLFFPNISNIYLFIFLLKSVKEEVGKQIQKECSSKIFPLQDSCMVRKVKILKKPKFDLTKLMELYQNDASLDKPVKKEAENALKTEWSNCKISLFNSGNRFRLNKIWVTNKTEKMLDPHLFSHTN